MYITKIIIENIKTYKKLEFFCHPKLNYIVGENNIGKTTIFDALLLWKMAYSELIQANGKNFYKKTNWNSMNINFGKLSIFRLVNAANIFNDSSKSAYITVSISNGEETFDLEIEIDMPNILDSYIRFRNQRNLENFQNFAVHCNEQNIKLKEAVTINITKPISSVLRDEIFLNKAQIANKSYLGRSMEVLRNKILNTSVDKKFEYLEKILLNVLGKKYTLILKNNNRDDDEHVKILIKEEDKIAVDLYIVGSGILHVLEIFSSLNRKLVEENKLNLLLLDEPDSHVHGNIQVKIIDELKTITNTQIFIISHNDKFITQAKQDELFYLNFIAKENCILTPSNIDDISHIQEELSGTLNEFAKIDIDKPIIILEGKTDKKIIETAWKKLNNNSELPFELISSGLNLDEETRTGSAKTVKSTIEYISTISNPLHKIIGLFDNDREGNEQYKGLNKNIFEEYNSAQDSRKHNSKEVYGLRLPCPTHRSDFITQNSITQRYFVIEHYFKDDVLSESDIKGENILTTNVFVIKGKKNDFSESVISLEKSEFEYFNVLFAKINSILEET